MPREHSPRQSWHLPIVVEAEDIGSSPMPVKFVEVDMLAHLNGPGTRCVVELYDDMRDVMPRKEVVRRGYSLSWRYRYYLLAV